MAGTYVDDLTAILASATADTDIFYIGKPGDADPDRQITRAEMGKIFAFLTGATFTGPVIFPSGPDVTLASTGNPLQIGSASGPNIAADMNEIQARDNGSAATLNLQVAGGDVEIGGESVALYGSNGNGEYVRFYNGVQICFLSASISLSSAVAANTGLTWPAAFNATPRAVGSQAESDGLYNVSIFNLGSPYTAANVTVREVRGISATRTVPVGIIAVGTWA